MNTEQRSYPGATAITVVTAIVGGIALLGAGGTAAIAAVNDATVHSDTQSVSVDGVEELDLEVSASDVTVQFAAVDEAQLQVEGNRSGDWTLRRDGSAVIVRGPEGLFGDWFGGGLFGNWASDDEKVVLTLPEELQDAKIDADLSLSAGSLDVDGAFGDVDVEVGAGRLFVNGSANSVDVDMSAGRADIDVDGVQEADFSVSAGHVAAELTGTAPEEVSINVSAGSLDLTLPDVSYAVQQEVSAGSFDNRLQSGSSERNSIVVSLSAGTVVLRPGD